MHIKTERLSKENTFCNNVKNIYEEILEAEKIEKETKENIQKIKKEREAKKKKNEELSLKKKQSAPKKRSRKQVEDEEMSTNDISLHDSDGIDTLDDFIKYTESQKSDSDCGGESNRNLNFTKIKTNQIYAIVEYEMEYFPGNDCIILVTWLTMCGTQGLQWKWPDLEDKI